jgi:cyclohexanone monooxygenase
MKRIVIIGAGPGGICLGIKLRESGYEDFVILEQAAGVGGTWHHNTYPGAACDVQSHLYSFSFEAKVDSTEAFATQPEILEYFEHCVAKYGLEPHLRLNTEVQAAQWDDDRMMWRVVTNGETFEADVVVGAVGMFGGLNIPDIPGLDAFTGTLFHSARWDHDLTGETVAVIGSGASAVQFIPTVAAQAGRLHLFQRSPQWVLPKLEGAYTEEELERFRTDRDAAATLRSEIFERVESVITYSDQQMMAAATSAGLQNLMTVEDPDVRRRLTPASVWGCHRPLTSNVYYPVFNLPHVELVTEAIEKVTGDRIVTVDGTERPVDTIVLGTGFATTRYLSVVDIVGRGGEHLRDAWADGAQAYLGITTSGFPNLFMLYGPNTNNGSILHMIECQVGYIVRQLERMDREGIMSMEVRSEVMKGYNAELQHDLDQIEVWQTACSGYYRGPSGRIVTQWPHTMREYQSRTSAPDAEAYEVVRG